MNEPEHRLRAGSRQQRAPPPDRYIVSGEGERMPWGWLSNSCGSSSLDLASREEDQRYWSKVLSDPPPKAGIERLVALGREIAMEAGSSPMS